MSEERDFRLVVNVLGWAAMAFLVFPVIVTLLVSFNGSFFIEFPPSSYSLDWYRNIADINKIGEATLISLMIATIAATLVTVMALGTAMAIVRYEFRGKAALTSFLLSPKGRSTSR